MKEPTKEIELLRSLWPDAELVAGGGRYYVLLPFLNVRGEGGEKTVSALLQPWANGDGYTTRLFFSERFTKKGENWNCFNILGRTWYACSWNQVPENIPWVEIVASHLKPLQ